MTDEEIAVIVEERLCEELPEFRLRLMNQDRVVREATINSMADSYTFGLVAVGDVITALSYVVVRKHGETTFVEEVIRDEAAPGLPCTTNGGDLTIHAKGAYREAVHSYQNGQYIRKSIVTVEQPKQYIKVEI